MVLLHAESVNIARRLTEKNEPDFLQEAFHGNSYYDFFHNSVALNVNDILFFDTFHRFCYFQV